jgi:hypothetical protein
MHGGKKVVLDKLLIALEKRRAKTIGVGTSIVIHGKEGIMDFLKRERPGKRSRLRGV